MHYRELARAVLARVPAPPWSRSSPGTGCREPLDEEALRAACLAVLAERLGHEPREDEVLALRRHTIAVFHGMTESAAQPPIREEHYVKLPFRRYVLSDGGRRRGTGYWKNGHCEHTAPWRKLRPALHEEM